MQFPNQDTRLMGELQKFQQHLQNVMGTGFYKALGQMHRKQTVYVDKFGNDDFIQALDALMAARENHDSSGTLSSVVGGVHCGVLCLGFSRKEK